VVTIGGGVVLDLRLESDAPRRAHLDRLRVLETAPLAERIALLARESRYGIGMADLVARTGLLEAELRKAAAASASQTSTPVIVLESPQFWLLDPAWVANQLEALHKHLKEFHRQNPLLSGVSKEELRSKYFQAAPPWLMDALLAGSISQTAQGTLTVHGETVRLSSHRVALKQDEEDAAAKIESAFHAGGLTTPAVHEVLAKSGVDPDRARTLLQLMLRDRRLVRVSDELVFHASAMQSLRALLASKKGQRFSVPEFKDWTGVSRKYAIPLLEFLDRERITKRDGDLRVVLSR